MVLAHTPPVIAIHRLQEFFTTWNMGSPRLVTFSAGLAFVDRDGPEVAFDAATAALRRAKLAGRNRLQVAGPEDRVPGATDPEPVPDRGVMLEP